MAPPTFLTKLSLMALSEKLLPIPPYPLSSPPCEWESDLNILSRNKRSCICFFAGILRITSCPNHETHVTSSLDSPV